VDAVSYSAYDVQSGDLASMKRNVTRALDFLRSHAPASAKNYIFIGEFGFPYAQSGYDSPPREQRLAAFIEAAAGWGARHVLYWQLFDNECQCHGHSQDCQCGEWPTSCQGFWLIDTSNHVTPLYELMRSYNGGAHVFKNIYRFWLHRNPEAAAVANYSKNFQTYSFSNLTENVLASKEFESLVPASDYVRMLFDDILGRSPNQQEIATWTAKPRAQALREMLNGNEFASRTPDSRFVASLYQNMLLRQPGPRELQNAIAALNTKTRYQLWRNFLDSQEFRLLALTLRTHDHEGDSTIAKRYWFSF
jgi:hypothetical protein